MTTRRILGARKGAGWISGVRLEPDPAPAVRWPPLLGPEHRQVGQALDAEPARKPTLHRGFRLERARADLVALRKSVTLQRAARRYLPPFPSARSDRLRLRVRGRPLTKDCSHRHEVFSFGRNHVQRPGVVRPGVWSVGGARRRRSATREPPAGGWRRGNAPNKRGPALLLCGDNDRLVLAIGAFAENRQIATLASAPINEQASANPRIGIQRRGRWLIRSQSTA